MNGVKPSVANKENEKKEYKKVKKQSTGGKSTPALPTVFQQIIDHCISCMILTIKPTPRVYPWGSRNVKLVFCLLANIAITFLY